MKLEAGWTYNTRCGAIAVVERVSSSFGGVYAVGKVYIKDSIAQWKWTLDGKSTIMLGKESLFDIVSEAGHMEGEDIADDDTQDKAINRQVGGDHYKKLAIQPIEYATANNLNACQFLVLRYITRYKDKGGKVDLEKAIHSIQMLIEMEYGD